MADKVCKICGNKRHIFKEGVGWVRCECYYQLRVERIMGKGRFPVPLLSAKDLDFKLSSPQRKALGVAIQQKVGEFNWKPMFIFSSTTAKDLAAVIIAKYIIINHSDVDSAIYTSLESLTESLFQKEKDEDAPDYLNCDILVLTIGKEMTNSAHKNLLYNIIYERVLNQRLLIILSSISKDNIGQIYSSKVTDLMGEYFDYYEC